MKALIIAPQPFFTPRGTPFSVYYRTLVTSELGVPADLLTFGQGEDVDIPGVRIVRLPGFLSRTPVKTGPSLRKLFLDCFLFLWTLALLVRHRYTIVHAHEEAVFFCRFLKPLFGFKLIYDMHSSLPQQLTNFNFTRSRLLIGLFRWLENGSIRAADMVITICPSLADYVLGLGTPEEKHVLIENSIFDNVRLRRQSAVTGDDNSHVETGQSPLPGIPTDRPLVVYAGTLEHYQSIDLLLEGFAHALRTRPDAYLIVLGGNPDQVDHYRAMADRLGLSGHCTFTGRVPQPIARHFNTIASVLVSPRREGMNTPLKIYEQLASGVPLVATRIEAHTQVLNDEVAFLVEKTPESMGQGLIEALAPDGRRNQVVKNARRLYTQHYSRDAYERKMRHLFSAVGACAG